MAALLRQIRSLAHLNQPINALSVSDKPPFRATVSSLHAHSCSESSTFQSRFSKETALGWAMQAVSILGWSVAALWISAELGHAEELSSTFSAPTKASSEKMSPLKDVELNASKQAEAKSNVHTARWRVFTDRARDLFSQGLYDEAEKYFFRALDEAKKGFGDEDPHVASCYNNLGEIFRMKKDYDKAEPFYLESVERLKHSLGADHESVGFALHNLAGFYLLQRRVELAQECYEGALKVKGKALGLDHPEYANTMFHLGEVIRLRGNLNDAVALITDSIRILEEAGLGHTRVAVKRMNRLSEILVFSGQLSEAETVQSKIVQILELSKGFTSLDIVTAMESLAMTLQKQGKINKCEELLERCIHISKKQFGSSHIRVATTLSKLGAMVFQQGQNVTLTDNRLALAYYEKAQGFLLEAVRIAELQWKENCNSKTLDSTKQKASHQVNAMPISYYPLLLVHTLITLGALGIHKLQLIDAKLSIKTAQDAEEALQHALALLEDESVQCVLGSSSEANKLHRDCLHHLAELQGKIKKMC